MEQERLKEILDEIEELDRRKQAAQRRARNWTEFATLSERLAELVRIGTLIGPLLALLLAMTPLGRFLSR